MAADLTHFLLPSSRLPKDVTFIASGNEVGAHKSLLAAAHPAFDEMFFGTDEGAKVNRVKVEGEVGENTFTLFLRHMYGRKMEVAAITEFLTLVELHSITCQFEQVELGKEVKERLRNLLSTEKRRPCTLIEVSVLLAKHKVEELLPLVDKKVKEALVGEEDLAGLLVMVNDGGPQAEMAEGMVARYVSKHCPSTQQLAAFVSKEKLPAGVLARILDDINDLGESAGTEVEVTEGEDFQMEVKEATTSNGMIKIYNAEAVDQDEIKQEKEIQDEKDIIERFLEFTNFPEELRAKMVEAFFEQAI